MQGLEFGNLRSGSHKEWGLIQFFDVPHVFIPNFGMDSDSLIDQYMMMFKKFSVKNACWQEKYNVVKCI